MYIYFYQVASSIAEVRGTSSDSSPPTKKSTSSKPQPQLAPASESPTVTTTESLPTYEHHLPQGESASVAFASGSGAGGSSSAAPGAMAPFSIFGPTPTRSLFDSDVPLRPHSEQVSIFFFSVI